MRQSHITRLLIVASLIVSVGCQRYEVSVNEQVIYEPPQLFREYKITDPTLRQCVKATIAENSLTKAEQLRRLSCPAGDIVKLDGLQVFTRLHTLGLAGNQIVSVAPLATLKELAQLNVARNAVQDFTPLSDMPNLSYLDARGNSGANCDSLSVIGVKDIKPPRHCAP